MTGSRVSIREGGWLQAKIPLPYSLKWVNAYLLPGEEGWTLIDPGLRTPDAEALWAVILREAGIPWNRIAAIFVTHHHPDHYGLAGWFQERTGAAVWMSKTAFEMTQTMWGEQTTFSGSLLHAFCEHGLPEELVPAMGGHLADFRERVAPHPGEVRFAAAGDVFRAGGIDWLLVGGEGHAPGHLSLYDPAGKTLICGDQLLPDISPNIGWMPEGDPDPLDSYLKSLAAMRSLDADRVYPGHRDPFGRFAERIGELLAHHARRLENMSAAIGRAEAAAFEVCENLFGAHLRDNIHNLRFALAETIAHLVHLERRGLLHRRIAEDGRIKFAGTDA